MTYRSPTLLLDTSVISAFAPNKPPVSEELATWVERSAEDLFIASITIAEIEQGLRKLRRLGGTTRADRLHDWSTYLISKFSEHIVALDAQLAREVGALSDAARSSGMTPGLADIVIAATASATGHIVLTRTMRHFEPLTRLHRGFACLDPFVTLPPQAV